MGPISPVAAISKLNVGTLLLLVVLSMARSAECERNETLTARGWLVLSETDNAEASARHAPMGSVIAVLIVCVF